MAKPNVNVQVGGPMAFIDALREYKTVVLQPNVVDNRNVLTQDMVSASNTKYVIKWNYDLQGKTITFPQNCLVEFDGGTINNGTIIGNNTMLIYSKPLDEVITATRQGTFIYNTTVADEEDITSDTGLLKFKDRGSTDGMGYVILRKNKTFAEQIANKPNTIFEIRYDFDLDGGEVTIREGCVLEFEGGSLSNGTLVCDNTRIINSQNNKIFTDVDFSGNVQCDAYVEWFGAVGDNVTDDTDAFRYAAYFSNKYNQIINLTLSCWYKISGNLNHYNNLDYDGIISFAGKSPNLTRRVPSGVNKVYGGIHLVDGTALFANSSTISVSLYNLSIWGNSTNWNELGTKIFSNCKCSETIIENCYISYIYAVFYNSGLWTLSKIHCNVFLGCYYFARITDDCSVTNASFVDSTIENNYINGQGWSQTEHHNNSFSEWRQYNGSSLANNFIDFYKYIYHPNVAAYGDINSINNNYQVFKYFYFNVSALISVKDIFNHTNKNTSPYIQKYTVDTYIGEDNVTYEVPEYIAVDQYCRNGIVFKDVVLENNIANVLFITTSGLNSPRHFIFEVASFKDRDVDVPVIAHKQGAEYTISLAYRDYIIDSKLATKVNAMPSTGSGIKGLFALGEYIIFDNIYYKYIADFNPDTNNAVAYRFKKVLPNNAELSLISNSRDMTGTSTINVVSKNVNYYAKNNTVTTIAIPDYLIGEVITITNVVTNNTDVVTFSNFKDKYGNPIVLQRGDVLTVIKTYSAVYLVSYYKKSEHIPVSGTFAQRPASSSIDVGFAYFCTNKQTIEGATDGITIYYKGNDVWVDALGRVVS